MFYPTAEITGNALTIEYASAKLERFEDLKDDRREYMRILNIQEFQRSKASKIQLIYEFLIIRKYRKDINWPT